MERRISGFYRALRDNDLSLSEDCIIEIDPDIENGVLVTRNKILKKNPDAIIAINAFTALGIMKELRDNDIAIPEQISITCFDDLEYASILYTPLTVAKQPLEEMCKESLALLEARIGGYKGKAIQKLLDGELVIRDSTKAI